MDNGVLSKTFGLDMRDDDAVDQLLTWVVRSEDYSSHSKTPHGKSGREKQAPRRVGNNGIQEHSVQLPHGSMFL